MSPCPSKPCVVTLILVLALCSAVEATVVSTCKEVAGNDRRIDYDFCVLELSKHHESPDADTWGLAKVATLVGAVNAGNAVYDIKAMLAKPSIDNKITRAALRQCQKLYNEEELAFLRAYDTINNRNYGAGKEQVGLGIPLAHQCDEIFAKASIPSPLTEYSSYTAKIGIICIAITNLIK
ncbi:unnamed protein product [Urochloa humidicola]